MKWENEGVRYQRLNLERVAEESVPGKGPDVQRPEGVFRSVRGEGRIRQRMRPDWGHGPELRSLLSQLLAV